MMPFRSSLPALALGAALLVPGLASAAACNTSSMTLGGVNGTCTAVSDAEISASDLIASIASNKSEALERMASSATGASGWSLLGYDGDDGTNGFNRFLLEWTASLNPRGGISGGLDVAAADLNGGPFSIDLDILALVRLGDSSSGAAIDGFLAFSMLDVSFSDKDPSASGTYQMTSPTGSTDQPPSANEVIFLARQRTPGGNVPEPGSIALLGAIGAALVAGRRRMKC